MHANRSLDITVIMKEEIYFALEKIENLNNENNSFNKCRVLLEIAQFTWLNYKSSTKKFNLYVLILIINF